MKNIKLGYKRWISVLMTMICICIPTSKVLANDGTKENTRVMETHMPCVNYRNDINGYDKFEFISQTRTTDEPTEKWLWSNGKYYVDGSSNYSTLYTNYYFTNLKDKKFSFSAGSSNKVKVDLVHKGLIVQTVVSSWTINAGESKSHTITDADFGGYSNSDKFYFRFNSSPIGNSYSISGSVG